MRGKRRLYVLLACLSLLAAGVSWFARNPLTAEERALVGWWKPPEEPFGPHPDSAVLDAVEYRQDRTIRYRMRTKTGEVVVEETAITWRVSGGHLVTVRRLRGRMARAFAGDFRATERCASVITWGGPDRCRIDRVNLPPGVALPPRFYTRCGPIDQP